MLQPRENEAIEIALHPRGLLHCGKHRPRRLVERPMSSPRRPFGDPTFERFDLLGRERLARIGRRHFLSRIVGENACDECRLGDVRRDHRATPVVRGQCALARVEPQLGLTVCVVRTVTSKTVSSQDRPHVSHKVDGLRSLRRRSVARGNDQREEQEQNAKGFQSHELQTQSYVE